MAKMDLNETLRIAERVFFEKGNKWLVNLSLNDAVDYALVLVNNGYTVKLNSGIGKGIDVHNLDKAEMRYRINAYPSKLEGFQNA